MRRFAELGYSDGDLGPNTTFLTERAAETAIAANVVQVRAVKPEIQLLCDFVNRHITNPAYQFPAMIDDVNFVFRWAGKGNTLKWRTPLLGQRGWDTTLHNADPDTRFLNAWNISQRSLDQLRLGEPPPDSKTLVEMNPFTTVEISVEDWERPNLTQKFVSGVLFNRAQRRGRTALSNLRQDVFEAFDPESLSRFKLVDMAADLNGRPFADIMPLAPIIREE